jgi:RNA polymerase sigma-70 factor (ECF subfamily)
VTATTQATAASPRPLEAATLPDHVTRLYRAAWAMCGCREDAEDLVQETYAKVLAKPRLIRGDDEIGYLMRVLRNTFVSSLRTADRRPKTTELEDFAHPAETRTSLRPEDAFEASEVYAAVAALPEQFRDAVVAVDVVGLSYKEAAKALDTREGTIMSRLYRARQNVAQTLG